MVVLGVVTTSGNVEVRDSTVGAAISWGGNLELLQNRIILGNVWAQGNVTVEDDAVVWGDIWAAENVAIGTNAQVKGSIYSGGSVTLKVGAVVTGNVSAASRITEEGTPPQYCVGCAPPSGTAPAIPLDSSAERRGQALLTWAINPPVTLQPGDQVSLSFVAKAISTDGDYCNETWAEPGGLATTTGLTAQVQVGAQAGACQLPVYLATETVSPDVLAVGDNLPDGFTYSIVIDNTARTEGLTLRKIQKLLPTGFEYVIYEITVPPSWQASTTITTSTFRQRELVTWRFDTPLVVPIGQSTTLDFDAHVTAPPLAQRESYLSEV